MSKRFRIDDCGQKIPRGARMTNCPPKRKTKKYIMGARCDKLNSFTDENKKLRKENNKIKTLLFQKIKELNDDYEKSAKAGMPTGGIVGELDSFEEICEKMGWLK